MKTHANRPRLQLTSELRNRLFAPTIDSNGYDLAALIIQMGRDHGIPSYTAWRRHCRLQPISTFDQMKATNISDPSIIDRIASIYRSIDDVDLFVMALAEYPINGALVGPTFTCIIGNQFAKVCKLL